MTRRRIALPVIAVSAAAVLGITGFTAATAAAPDPARDSSSAEKTPPTADAPTEAAVQALFDDWNASLATGDPTQVAQHYADDAVLLRDTGARRIVVQSVPRPRAKGIEVITLPCRDQVMNPRAIRDALVARGFGRVLIEGGGATIAHFLEAGLLDRERRGKWVYFKVRPEPLASLRSALSG